MQEEILVINNDTEYDKALKEDNRLRLLRNRLRDLIEKYEDNNK